MKLLSGLFEPAKLSVNKVLWANLANKTKCWSILTDDVLF